MAVAFVIYNDITKILAGLLRRAADVRFSAPASTPRP